MRPRDDRVRSAALLAVGALAVHQIRYRLAFGARTDHALAVQGHAYLEWLIPLAVGLLVLAFSLWLSRLASGRRGVVTSTRRVWAATSAALVFIYALQESLEGVLAAGHPGGLAAIAAHSGWIAIPAAALVGAAIALAHHLRRPPVPGVALDSWSGSTVAAAVRLGRPRPAHRPITALLAAHLAARPPPPAFV